MLTIQVCSPSLYMLIFAKPMERVVYEIYRDEAAYHECTQQPYIEKLKPGRQPYVQSTSITAVRL